MPRDTDARSFIARQASAQHRVETERVIYDESRQISLVHRDGGWIPATDARRGPPTKKADIEVGEDVKGVWR